ncbi:ScbR family autoregulator-binding transcription factor [Actinokineospora bangkokensis]|uniref:TetR family transcriptional regulator n=1 Tax=Actinokineospora bangkokensis TaxID=1193682 RepID=A0A1Q9LBY6_9PSEU|nr:ScbR family autoregulator-binding transcription factor [Actinokineospora bangkokensis]OLR89529.1 TetR family transcriptional regulator [Actinokineospora bangkokensis]
MAKQERAERTRTAILDAAAEAFEEHGFAGARLSDILARASVTKGALYFHFQSKEEIARAIIDEQFTIWPVPDPADNAGVQGFIDLTHEMARRLQGDVRIRASIRLVIEYGTFTDPATTAYQGWISTGERFLGHAQDKGDVRAEVSPRDVATYIIGSFTGVQVSSEVLSGRTDLSDRVTTMWRIILPGIVAPRRLARFRPEGSTTPARAGLTA